MESFHLDDIKYSYETDAGGDVVHVLPQSYTMHDLILFVLENKSSNDPFYIVELDKIVQKYNEWTTNMPKIVPYYAVKCNPDPMIIRLLAKLGCGFDCASKDEILLVKSLTDTNKIVYANPCKETTNIGYAKANGVNLMTFDSRSELKKISVSFKKAQLLLRLKVEDETSVCSFSSKFGCKQSVVPKLLEMGKILGLNIVGVSFHVGSGCTDPNLYKKAIYQCRNVFEMAKKIGINMTILDIGGGFPGTDDINEYPLCDDIECTNEENDPSDTTTITSEITNAKFSDIACAVNRAIDECFGDYENLEVIAEPGRFFSTTSHTLVTNIIGIKEPDEYGDDNNTKFAYTINDGVYGSFSCIKYDHANPNIKPILTQSEPTFESVIFGPTCDSIDTITTTTSVPELSIGDWMSVRNFGAYTRASSTTFNGFKPPKPYYIIRKKE